jgi:hypothetical protein
LFQSPQPFVENLDYLRFFRTVQNFLNGSKQIIGIIKGVSTELSLHVSQ